MFDKNAKKRKLQHDGLNSSSAASSTAPSNNLEDISVDSGSEITLTENNLSAVVSEESASESDSSECESINIEPIEAHPRKKKTLHPRKKKNSRSTKEMEKVTKKWEQKFLNEWLEVELYKPWLERRFNRKTNSYTAYCAWCEEFKGNSQTGLKRHCKRQKHIALKKNFEEVDAQRRQLALFINSSSDKQVVVMELHLCLFLAEHNLALSLIDSLVALLRVLFPDDITLKYLSMAKQKCSNIIRFGMYHNDRITDFDVN